jgi:glucuronate isomerase
MQTSFLSKNFCLGSEPARELYHSFAKDMPIVDFHTHLPIEQIANDKTFESLGRIWLEDDHYKWRAMRINGVDEKFCTGDTTYREKYNKWAETVPYLLRSPLYVWTHMELREPFGIEKVLKPETADEIHEEATEKLQNTFSVRTLLDYFDVKVVCTSDDPADSLDLHHELQNEESFPVDVLPTFRPDNALDIEDPVEFKQYLEKLGSAAGQSINGYDDLLEALEVRYDDFDEAGCRMADHGIDHFHAADYDESEVREIFDRALNGKQVSENEAEVYKSALMDQLARFNHEKGWTQQLHVGPFRDVNSRMHKKLGPDSGFDSIGDSVNGKSLAKFLDRLDQDGQLAKTILYNIDPSNFQLFASIGGCFDTGPTPGKIQLGPAWWFLDNRYGMEDQLNAVSKIGVLSSFIGMLTDSRSFLSFSRHDYFRRILCHVFGQDMKEGLLPTDIEWTGEIVENICYHNARNYLDL